jgi:hypothetical protein
MIGRQQRQQPWQGFMGSCSSGNTNRAAAQLHELAWSSLLQQQQPKLQSRAASNAAAGECNPVVPAAVPVAAGSPRSVRLQAKLQQYMQAHVQWRQQQMFAEPLLPAEKWPTLEHEEQVRLCVLLLLLARCLMPVFDYALAGAWTKHPMMQRPQFVVLRIEM